MDLLLATCKLKIKAAKYAKKSHGKMCLNLERLESKDVAAEYLVHTENHFKVLLELGDMDMSPEKLWNKMKDVWHTTAMEVVVKGNKQNLNHGSVQPQKNWKNRREMQERGMTSSHTTS